MTLKAELRKVLLENRKQIGPKRRQEAALKLAEKTIPPGPVLSFSSFGSEIDLSLLNRKLASEKRLFLPRVEEDRIAIYAVENLDTQLLLSSSQILEPNPTLCKKYPLSEMAIALVPGLGFDSKGNRIGYGKGHYDRLLTSHTARLIGIGFLEQKRETLPHDPWDLTLDDLFLF